MTLPVRKSSRRAFTLVELMTTLVIFALVATAATAMLASSANTQRYVVSNTNAVSQTELAFRRIVENLRSASAYSMPNTSQTTTNEIDLVTQSDTTLQNNPNYNVRYSLLGTQLQETDDRYGGLTGVSNTLVSDVTNFTATLDQSTKPTRFIVTLTVSPPDSPPITRTAYITSRNF